MKQYIFVLVALLLAGCAGARMEQLEKMAKPYDPSVAEASIPQPVAVNDELEVTDRVVFKTSMGTIVVGLYGKAAPATVVNFLEYVDAGFYSGKIFHRVIPGFMIQGGGFTVDLEREPTSAPIELELIPGLEHGQGVISMARTQVTSSATSQFFICVMDAEQLNGEYAAFGKVEEGLDVAMNISQVVTEAVEIDLTTMEDVPAEPVIIESATLLK